jgi:hypothetical protein
VVVLACAATLAASGRLAAQENAPAQAAASPDREARAEEAFRNGREALKRGDPKAALAFFEESQRLFPTPLTLVNIAVAEEQVGRLAAALRHLRQAERELAGDDKRLPIVQERIALVAPRVARLRLELPPDGPDDAVMELDGAPARAGVLFEIDPGPHRLVVRAPGRRDHESTVLLAEGENRTMTVAAGARADEAPAPAPAAREGLTARQWAGVASAGAGAVALAVGIGTGIAAITNKSDLEEICPEPSNCTVAGVELADEGRALAVVSTVTFVLGLAGLGVGAFLYFGETEGDAVSVTAGPAPGGGVLVVRGAL